MWRWPWSRPSQNEIFLGKSDTGKIHLASRAWASPLYGYWKGVRVHRCPGGASVRRTRPAVAAVRPGDYRLAALHPVHQAAAEALFQFLCLRHERGSLLITTNLDFDRRTKVFRMRNAQRPGWTDSSIAPPSSRLAARTIDSEGTSGPSRLTQRASFGTEPT